MKSILIIELSALAALATIGIRTLACLYLPNIEKIIKAAKQVRVTVEFRYGTRGYCC
jgi:hypothetical protein